MLSEYLQLSHNTIIVGLMALFPCHLRPIPGYLTIPANAWSCPSYRRSPRMRELRSGWRDATPTISPKNMSFVLSYCFFLFCRLCVFSMCVFSLCVFSMCVFSMYTFSMCVFSMYVFSMCVFSMCVFSMCVFSMCVFSMCTFSTCVFSMCVCSMCVCMLNVVAPFLKVGEVWRVQIDFILPFCWKKNKKWIPDPKRSQT
jgi:hypothetical protein